MEEKNRETEKKFLIEYPTESVLNSIAAENRSFIVQTYLLSQQGVTSRVRLRRYHDTIRYFKTEKRRISDMSCFEDERELTKEEYLSELKAADPEKRPIEKERLLLFHDGHVFEIDIYPFWSDRAIMEVELSSEDEEYSLPGSIKVIRDVTGDRRYKNAALARALPKD